jgi:DUF1680 family protein
MDMLLPYNSFLASLRGGGDSAIVLSFGFQIMFIRSFFIAVAILVGGTTMAQGQIAFDSNAEAEIHPVALKAEPFALPQVRLLDGPFKTAQQRDEDYLLLLEPDRLLSKFWTDAGLPAKAPCYGGWEAEGVAGQTLGHYLSACSLMYAATGDRRFADRANYIVTQLGICQDANGNGYAGAVPDWHNTFENLKARHGRMIGWVPWYTIHKDLAGLRDAYVYVGNQQAKQVLVKFADWVGTTIDPLTDAEMANMLQTEQGGMNEVLADVYSITGDKKYIGLAHRFSHKAVMDPLAAGKDELTGLHANTQIPKLIGATRIYTLTGEDYFLRAPAFFWQTVVGNRTWAQGGNGDREHFFDPERSRSHLSQVTAETCNVYNMLKLTKALFTLDPRAEYAEYNELALFNQILGSQDPRRGMFTYHQSLRPGGFKIYSDPFNAMWCCVGTGMENHARYTESIYFHTDSSLYVNQFIASELNWQEKGFKLRQDTQFPNEPATRFTITVAQPTELTMRIRVPKWIDGKPTVKINGQVQEASADTDSFISLKRTWQTGDTIDYGIPMSLHEEPLHDAPDEIALKFGPIVLAADLGTQGLDKVNFYQTGHNESIYADYPAVAAPVLYGNPHDVVAHIHPVADASPLTFRMQGASQPDNVTLRPYYQTHFVRYTVYFKVYPTQADFLTEQKAEQTRAAAAADKQRQLDAHTVDQVSCGEQQSENDHHFESNESNSAPFMDTHWRDARGWIEYQMKVLPDHPMQLMCTYWGSDNGNRTFSLLIDGKTIATESLHGEHPDQFFNVAYPIPEKLTRGKQSVTVRFVANPGNIAGGIFGVRMLGPTEIPGAKAANSIELLR